MDEVQRGERLHRGTIKQDSFDFHRGLMFQRHVLQMSSSLRLQLSRNRSRFEGSSRSPVTGVQIGSLQTVNGTVQILTSYADFGPATSDKARVDHADIKPDTTLPRFSTLSQDFLRKSNVAIISGTSCRRCRGGS